MRFARPELLLLLLALPLLSAVGWLVSRARYRALARFAGGAEHVARFRSAVSPHLRASKQLLLHVAFAAAILAAARPQWGTQLETVDQRGADVVVLVDHSLSMAAEDLAPSRLAYARHAVDTLLGRMAGNRVALVAFAGQPSLLCPLTADHGALRLFLDTLEPEATQVPGTALAEALDSALRAFGKPAEAREQRGRAIVLFSDGEDHEGGIDEAARRLRELGIQVFAVGCGTARGAPIPTAGAGAGGGHKTDREGQVVTTRLDEAVLESLVLATGGRYFLGTPTEVEVDELSEAIEGLDTARFGQRLRARYEERYQLPLLLGWLALLAETLLGDRRRTAGVEG